MSEAADVDRVRQDLVDMPPAEQAAAVDTDRKAKALSVEFLLQTHHASRLEIAAEGKQSQCHKPLKIGRASVYRVLRVLSA
jgi:hypothetical protein